MKPYTAVNPVFRDTIQITETSDSAHADNINAAPKYLLENTLSNRQAIEELRTSTGNTEESEYSAVSAYQVGDYCIYNNELYRCIVAIVQGEQWNAQHWVKTTIANELLLLNKKEIEVVDPMTTTVAGFAADALRTKAAISEIQTKAKSNSDAIVSANNRINSANTEIGTIKTNISTINSNIKTMNSSISTINTNLGKKANSSALGTQCTFSLSGTTLTITPK